MSCLVDYRCEDCNEVTEYDKVSIVNDSPKNIECSKCGSLNTYRIFGCATYEVAEGILGNARNGYSKGHVYHTALSTPKKKGTVIK
jgi:hypothetical protein